MAVPSYTTDLSIFDDASANTNWDEFTGYTASAPPDVDTDYAIYGSSSITADRAKTGLSSIGSDAMTASLPTNGAFFVWSKFLAPNSLATFASGGIRVGVGSSTGNFYVWHVGGSDTYAYGGWINYAVDPTIGSPDDTQGTPTGTYAAVTMCWNCPTQAPSKGNPFSVDIIRYGRGESRFTGGETSNYATINGFALVNDNPTTGRLGLLQKISGGYLFKGLMSLGLAATAVDMRDANVAITIDDTLTVGSAFNRIEVHNTASNVEWTSFSITKVGSISKGQFEAIDNATIAFDACTFTDMDTFIFQSNSTITSSTFRRCSQVTVGGGSFTSCLFTGSTSTPAVSVTSLNLLSTCDFISAGTGYAIDLGTISADTPMSWDSTHSGYGASQTTNAVILVSVDSGMTLTINVTGGDSPTVNNTGLGTVLVQASVSLILTGIKDNSKVYIYDTNETADGGTDDTLLDSTLSTSLVSTGNNENSFTYSYNAGTLSGTTVNIKVLNLDYQMYRLPYILTSSNSSIPVSQITERNYLNPA